MARNEKVSLSHNKHMYLFKNSILSRHKYHIPRTKIPHQPPSSTASTAAVVHARTDMAVKNIPSVGERQGHSHEKNSPTNIQTITLYTTTTTAVKQKFAVLSFTQQKMTHRLARSRPTIDESWDRFQEYNCKKTPFLLSRQLLFPCERRPATQKQHPSAPQQPIPP